MAEQKKTPKRLITYGDNQYSFDELEKSVLGNYNNYAQKFGYNRDKFMKDYRALTEMLRLIKDDPNATFESGRINFSGNYANEKGAFGKARNNSKHYSHPAWMILDTLQGMTPYEEPKPERKKITKAGLQDAVKSEIVEGWNDLPDAEKQLAIKEALTNVMNRYKWDNPDLYELEDGRDLNYYRSMFDNALSALQTTDNPNDDLLRIYSTFGLTKPVALALKPQFTGWQADYINGLVGMGLSEDVALNMWNTTIVPKLVEKYTEDFNKNHGLISSTSSTTNNTSSSNNTSSASTSSSSNTPAGVVATNNNSSVKSGGDEPPKQEYSDFNNWESDYMKADNNKKRELLAYLKNNVSKMSNVPTSNTRDYRKTSGLWFDKKTGTVKTNRNVSLKDGGYLLTLKQYMKNARQY